MMTAPPTRLGRALLGLALAALLAAGAAGPARAAPPVTTAAVTAGTLSQATSANPSFAAALDPNGADVTATYTLPRAAAAAAGT